MASLSAGAPMRFQYGILCSPICVNSTRTSMSQPRPLASDKWRAATVVKPPSGVRSIEHEALLRQRNFVTPAAQYFSSVRDCECRGQPARTGTGVHPKRECWVTSVVHVHAGELCLRQASPPRGHCRPGHPRRGLKCIARQFAICADGNDSLATDCR